MKNNYFFALIASFILIGCTGKSNDSRVIDFNVVDSLSYTIIVEDLELGYPEDICSTNQYIFILAPKYGDLIHIYDKQSGRYLKSGIHLGHGPEELDYATCMSYDEENNNLSVFDLASQKISFFHFFEDSLCFAKVSDIYLSEYKAVLFADSVNGHIIVNGFPIESEGITPWLCAETATAVSKYSDFSVSEELRAVYFENSRSSVSPTGTHYVHASLYGSVLDIFEITDTIVKTASFILDEPIGKSVQIHFEPSKGNKYGFSDLYASRDYIYALYIGDSNPDAMTRIAKWNWQGKALHLGYTDRQFLKICADQVQRDMCYGICLAPDGRLQLIRTEVR